MDETYDFFIKQISSVLPQVSGRLCRIREVRLIKFPGHATNDLVLYRVDVQSPDTEVWETAMSSTPQDHNYFGFIRPPREIDGWDLLTHCHRHFMQKILNAQARFSISDYLSLYKRETVYPVKFMMDDRRLAEYWDTMLMRAIVLKAGGGYEDVVYGTVKVRQQWPVGDAQPDEPYRSGVLYSFPLAVETLDSVMSKVRATARYPSIFTKCLPIHTVTLEMYHASTPEVSQ